jgi:DNA-binding NarL/FixJ family response regulator
MEAISIVVTDDHPAVLHGVVDVLEANSDMTVVAACPDGTAALRAIRQLAPMVAVVDILMPGLNGLDVVASISAERCPTNVVVLTATASEEQLLTAIAGGAKGIVFKDAALPELVQCVRRVAAGGQWLPSNLINAALARGARQAAEPLTNRERQIVEMVAEGLSNKEIGRRLDLSEGTVKVHLHNVYRKLGVNNRTALAAMAITKRASLQKHLGCTQCEGYGYRLLTKYDANDPSDYAARSNV